MTFLPQEIGADLGGWGLSVEPKKILPRHIARVKPHTVNLGVGRHHYSTCKADA